MTTLSRIARASVAAVFVSLLLAPGSTHAAQSLNLAWNHCLGDAGVQNASFACDTNSGLHVMAGSFVLANDMPLVTSAEVVPELASASAALPPWWQLKNLGTCRQNSLAVNFFADPVDVGCVDWVNSQAVGGIGAYCTSTFPCFLSVTNVAIVKLLSAVPPDAAQTLIGGVEYFDFHIVINHAKTVGTGSCTGCDVPVCIVLNSINVVARDNVEHRFIATPTAPGSNYVTWQGGGVPVTPNGTGCPAATAAKRSTWGSVKSLYR